MICRLRDSGLAHRVPPEPSHERTLATIPTMRLRAWGVLVIAPSRKNRKKSFAAASYRDYACGVRGDLTGTATRAAIARDLKSR